ncbi:MAG: cysteine desulfurase family protein [Acidobacteriota bacterium]
MTPHAIYLDHHATTPVDPRVVDAMLPFFTVSFGNPASRTHAFGWEAAQAVENSRAQVATLIGASPEEIVFTSGATESNNLAIFGAIEGYGVRQIVTARTEHPSVLEPVQHISRGSDCRVRYLPLDRHGIIPAESVSPVPGREAVLVSVMLASNEIGTIQDLAALGRILKRPGVIIHSDAAQAVGHIPVDVNALGVDLLSLSAHKLHGPKGVGALYVRDPGALPGLAPRVRGGGQERDIRAGTLNVPGIVGLGAACAICADEMATETRRVAMLRDRLQQRLITSIEGVTLNGHPERRLPGNLNLCLSGVDGEALIGDLDNVALSTGSACSSADATPSHVLLALDQSPDQARSAVRFGLGRFTTVDEIDTVADRVVRSVDRLRRLSPFDRP